MVLHRPVETTRVTGQYRLSVVILISATAVKYVRAGKPAVYDPRGYDTKNNHGGDQQECPMQEASVKCLHHAEQQAKKNSIPQVNEGFAGLVPESDEFKK